MSSFVMKLPDVGEGVAEAEIVEWLVAVGDEVTPDSVLAEVLTDKATVEISPPVAGVVTALHGEPGDVVAVGSALVEIDTGQGAPDDGPAHDGSSRAAHPDEPATEPAIEPTAEQGEGDEPTAGGLPAPPTTDSDRRTAGDPVARPAAAPAVRRRAADLGIALTEVTGTGPDGRIVHADLDRLLTATRSAAPASSPPSGVSGGVHTETVRGVRRRIAERLAAAWAEIPHITYVEEIDVTEVERLRAEMNETPDGVRLTLLPFVGRAIVLACREQPGLNAHYDGAAETLTTFDDVHLGIATQTDSGLMVPVARHAQTRTVHDLAREIVRVTSAARDGSATRDELSGSTISITSLGAIGGIATTPIINPPEVAIVGINKIEIRPVWADGGVRPRRMMNLSSSFDHRMVDGWDAATFVQRIKRLLETPALLFV